MKKILLVFATVCITVSGIAQKTADIGIWGGTSTYFGDLNGVKSFQSFNPNFGAYFRYNFNARVGVRAMFLTGKFAEEGTIAGLPWSFEKNVQDVSVQAEINYLRYILGNKKTRFTSYILGGFGITYFPYEMDPTFIFNINPDHNKGNEYLSESVMVPTIPFGFGFKFNLGHRLGLGAEYLMRKTISDKLDDLDDPLAYINSKGEEITYTDMIHNNDWPVYLGIHITYNIYIGKQVCPVYDSKIK